MKRHSKGGKAGKAARRKATSLKRAIPAKAVPGRRSETTGQETETARLIHEREEALQQLAATVEILRLISNSPTDTQPVFDAIVQSGLKLFPDAAILIALPDGDKLRAAAFAETDTAQAKALLKRWPISLTRQYLHAVAILDRKVIDILDARKPVSEFATGAKYFLTTGYRAITIMPMISGNGAIGALSVVRLAPGPLSDKQIAALKTFANQAVIAIENTRLLNELRQRTTDLTELLEQQTATSEVLKVISCSQGELEPVFNAMLANAVRICEAKFGTLYLREGDTFRAAALHNAPPAFVEFWQRGPHRPSASTVLSRVLRTKEAVHISDITADQAYIERDPLFIAAAELGGFRTVLAVPMLKETDVLGAIYIYRQEVWPFSDKQIALLASFASQAVIAIENARLLNELRESLDQQTATSEVLSVISSSPGELEPVFDAMLANATKLCDASYGTLWLHEGHGQMRAAALHGRLPEAFLEKWGVGTEFHPSPAVPSARAMHSRKPVQLVDLMEDQSYTDGDALAVAAVQVAGIRSVISVPMVKDDVAVGAMTIYRREVRPFTDKQIALVTNFAAQAVIAIENTRLLNELRQSLERQTATADVLRVISSSPGELEPVFQAMLENATRICEAKFGVMTLYEGGPFRAVALHNALPEFAEARRREPLFLPAPNAALARVAASKETLQIPDLRLDESYLSGDPATVIIVKRGGARTLIDIPMLKDGELVGVFGIYRQEVRPFTDKQIELLQNFAAQAVIAIENTRLLNELREPLEQQTATSQVLSVISSSPGELEPVFQAMLENATRICEAKFGTMYFREGDGFRAVAMHGAPPAYVESRLHKLVHPGPATGIGRLLQTKQAVQIEDASADQGYSERDPMRVSAVELGGVRTSWMSRCSRIMR